MALAALGGSFQLDDFGRRHIGKQFVVTPHHLIADRHDLAEDIARRLGYPDVVSQALGHLLHAVEPFEQRRGDYELRLLHAVGLLNLASHQQVNLLVRPAKLDVGFERNRVVTLRERV